MLMKYMTVSEASKKWGISDRRVRFLCSQGRIRGIIQQGRRYLIPDGTAKPSDERVRTKGEKTPKKKQYNDFTRLDFLKNMLAELPDVNVSAGEQLREDFTGSFTYNCGALEGNTMSQQEVNRVLSGQVCEGHSMDEHLGVVGLKDAWEYARVCAADKKPLSQQIIRNVHSYAMLNDPFGKGKYRKVKVRIKGTDSDPVYLDLMEPRINELLNLNTQRKKEMHPIERIARFHLEFEGIHPFARGNGIVGRILTNIELMQNGYPPINFRKNQQQKYEEAIHAYYLSHQPEAMIKLISENLEDSLEKQVKATKMKKRTGTGEAEQA